MLKTKSSSASLDNLNNNNNNNTKSTRDNLQDEFYDNYFSYYTNRKESEQTKYRILMNCLYWFGFSSDVYFGFLTWSFLIEFYSLLFQGYVKLEFASLPPIIPLVFTFFIPCILLVILAIYSKTKSMILSYLERSKSEQQLSNTTIQQDDEKQKEPPSGSGTSAMGIGGGGTITSSSITIAHKKTTPYHLGITSSSTPISIGGGTTGGSYQDYYYQHPSPSSHIFGRNESLMRVLEAEDDTVIRGRRMRMHSMSADTTHMIAVTSSSTPLLIPSSSNQNTPIINEDNNHHHFVEYNFEYLQEKKQTIGERFDTILHICRRPFFYLCSCAGLITNLPLFDGPQVQNRVICLGISLVFLIGHLVICMRDAHKKQCERGLWSFIIGWVLIVNLRFGYCSLNPLFIGERTWKISTFSLVFCIVFAIVSLTEEIIVFFWRRWILYQEEEDSKDMNEQERYEIDENEQLKEVKHRGFSLLKIYYIATSRGLAFGCLLFLTHWLFTSSTTLVRWSGLPGFPYNLSILVAINIGLIISSISLIFRSIIGTISLLTFCFILSYLPTNDSSFSIIILTSSIIASLVLPTIWVYVLIRKNTGYAYPTSNFSTAVCAFVALATYMFQVILLEFSSPSSMQDPSVVWISTIINKRAHALLIFSSIIVSIFGIGLGNVIRRPVIGRKEDPLIEKPANKEKKYSFKGLIKWLIREDDFVKKESPFSHINKRVLGVILIITVFSLLPSLGYRLLYQKNLTNQYSDKLITVTFNVHNGYDMYGRNNFDRVLQTLKNLKASVIGLQQSDTNRISASNNDLLEYLSFYLNMHEYYGPSLREGSFGNSILSSYPLEDRGFYLLPSDESEQAVMVKSYVRVSNLLENSSNMTDFYFFTSSFSVRNHEEQTKQALSASRILKDEWKEGGIENREFETMFLVGDLNFKSTNTFFGETCMSPVISNEIIRSNVSQSFTTFDYIAMSSKNHTFHRYFPFNSTIVYIDSLISEHPPLMSEFIPIGKK